MGRRFHLGDVLSIIGEGLVSPRLLDGVYDILTYMKDDNLLSQQLPDAADECRLWLLRWYPQLAEVVEPEAFDSEAAVWAWLDEQVARFGETLEVWPIPRDEHAQKHPLFELDELTEKPIIVMTDSQRDQRTNYEEGA